MLLGGAALQSCVTNLHAPKIVFLFRVMVGNRNRHSSLPGAPVLATNVSRFASRATKWKTCRCCRKFLALTGCDAAIIHVLNQLDQMAVLHFLDAIRQH